ncbi:MAG: PilZ domain-containing protein [Pseudomonadota bacterium]
MFWILDPIRDFLKKRNSDRTEDYAQFAKDHKKKVGAKLRQELMREDSRYQHKRKEERVDLSVIAEMSLPDKGYSLDGAITEASRSGLTFRPATDYMVERSNERVQIITDNIRRNGVIRSTRVNGYGVQLTDPLSTADHDTLKEASVNLQQGEIEMFDEDFI